MDGQTDTFLVACSRWHSMQRGKTDEISLFSVQFCTISAVLNVLVQL